MKLYEPVATVLARDLFPELYWFIYNNLVLSFTPEEVLHREQILRRDAGTIAWYLLRERYVIVDRYYAVDRPVPWEISAGQQRVIIHWVKRFAFFRMNECGFATTPDFLDLILLDKGN